MSVSSAHEEPLYPSWDKAAILGRDELYRVVTVDPTQGLSSTLAAERLRRIGVNALDTKSVSRITIFLRQFCSSFVYLLIGAAALSIFLKEYPDALIILSFIILNALLGFAQEFRAEKSLELLKSFVIRECRVRRDGIVVRIPVSDVVPGDVVLLDAGDMVPGDGVVIAAEDLLFDESALTGESIAVSKTINIPLEIPRQYTDAGNIAFARTSVLAGSGEIVIVATGKTSVVGSIQAVVAEEERPSTFEDGIGRFSGFILRLVLGTIPIIFVLHLLTHQGEIALLDFVLFVIALTVSAIPEALPLVTTITITGGALRLAKKNVVPRRLSAIEDLGSIEVLCTDKTGTITENALSVATTQGDEDLLFWASAAPYSAKGAQSAQNSVYDAAILRYCEEKCTPGKFGKPPRRIAELPFDPKRKRESALVELESGERVLVVRGAPESVSSAHDPRYAEALRFAEDEGRKGRRTLAIALLRGREIPSSYTPEDEDGAQYIGMLTFADPLKSSTKKAVCDAELLGVRVKVITGDALEVAVWAAKEAGIIDSQDDAIRAADLLRLPEKEQEAAVLRYDVFARTMPLEKHRIIELLARQKLVGFLGEGFNDAPALKRAHVGLAVQGASDVAQDASDIVLLNPSLYVIVDGIKEGRRIFANTTKYIRATLTSNFGNFYALAFSSLFIPYLPMLPMQILLLNLLSDFPMIAVATDNVDERELDRPKGYQVKEIVSAALVLGVISTIFDFAFFGAFVGQGEKVLQTMWFIGSVITELVLLFSIRTRLPFWRAGAPSLTIIILTMSVSLSAILLPFTSFGQNVFGFIAPSGAMIAAALALALLYLMSTEIMKLIFYRWWDGRKDPA